MEWIYHKPEYSVSWGRNNNILVSHDYFWFLQKVRLVGMQNKFQARFWRLSFHASTTYRKKEMS